MQSELIEFCRLGRLLNVLGVFTAYFLAVDLDLDILEGRQLEKIGIKRRSPAGDDIYFKDALFELGIVSDPDLVIYF